MRQGVNMGRLDGKVAVITGSTKGIGRATARRFAAEGARCIVTGRDQAAGSDVVTRIRDAAGEAQFVLADLGDEAQTEHLFARTRELYGGLDILVNNASTTELQRGPTRQDGSITLLSLSQWERVIRVPLTGVFLASRAAIPMMAERGGGSIVHVSSTTSLRGVPGTSAYTAAKGAVNSLTRVMAVDYAKDGIRVNTVVAGLVITSDTARSWIANPERAQRVSGLTRFCEPEDLANAILFLASDEAACITGQLLVVDSGSMATDVAPESPQPQTVTAPRRANTEPDAGPNT